MRNKTNGLSRLEITKLQNGKPLALSKTIEILNLPSPTRFQIEQAIKSIKHNACQHIFNTEMNRPTVSHSDFLKLRDLVIFASHKVHVDIYAEYKAECLLNIRGREVSDTPRAFVNPQSGVQHQYAHMQY